MHVIYLFLGFLSMSPLWFLFFLFISAAFEQIWEERVIFCFDDTYTHKDCIRDESPELVCHV